MKRQATQGATVKRQATQGATVKRQSDLFNSIWIIIGWIGVWQGVFGENPYYLAGGAVMIVAVWLEKICQAIYETRRHGPR